MLTFYQIIPLCLGKQNILKINGLYRINKGRKFFHFISYEMSFADLPFSNVKGKYLFGFYSVTLQSDRLLLGQWKYFSTDLAYFSSRIKASFVS